MHLLVPCQWSGSPFMGKNGSLFVSHGRQTTISEKTFIFCQNECLCTCTSICFWVCSNVHIVCVYVRLAWMLWCQCFCIHALVVNTTREEVCSCAREFFMTFRQFRTHLTSLWAEVQITMVPSIQRPKVVAKSMGKVDSSEQISPSRLEWFDSRATRSISRITSNKRLAAHELIPLAFWPTCYWEMTCFLKLHHEAEMINGLKSDKRIWSGLLFPAYFNHVVMKWIC